MKAPERRASASARGIDAGKKSSTSEKKNVPTPEDQWREERGIGTQPGDTIPGPDPKKQDIRDMGRGNAAQEKDKGVITIPGAGPTDKRIVDGKKMSPETPEKGAREKASGSTIAPADRTPARDVKPSDAVRDKKEPPKRDALIDSNAVPGGKAQDTGGKKGGDKKIPPAMDEKKIPGKAEKKKEGASVPATDDRKDATRPEPVFIAVIPAEPGTRNLDGWRESFTWGDIAKWARSYGLKPDRNAGPLTDGAARFVSRFGSKVLIEGLERNRRYGLWIDFVTYEQLGDNAIDARMEVYADREKIGDINFGTLTRRNNPVRLDLPYHLTMDGKVEILFREFSPEGGIWGVWDLIITDARALPERFAGSKVAPSGMIDGGGIIEPRSMETKGRKRREDVKGVKKIIPASEPSRREKKLPGGNKKAPGASDKKIRPASPQGIDAGEKKSPADNLPKKQNGRTDGREKKARDMLMEDKLRDTQPVPLK